MIKRPNPQNRKKEPDRKGLIQRFAKIISDLQEQYSIGISDQIDQHFTANPTSSLISIEGFIRNWSNRIGRALSVSEQAEYLAFTFRPPHERSANVKSPWNTYYGPIFEQPNAETGKYSPDLSEVNPKVIQLWKDRTTTSSIPILRARYADIVWDFEGKLPGHRKSIEFAKLAIEAYIASSVCNQIKFQRPIWLGLSRALDIATMTRDKQRKQSIVNAMIRYENLHGEDDLPGTWGNVFSLLVLCDKGSIQKKQRNEIVLNVLRRYMRILANPKANVNGIQYGFRILNNFYMLEGGNLPVRISDRYTAWMLSFANDCQEAIQSQYWLISTFFALKKAKVEDLAERILLQCEKIGLSVVKSLTKSTFTTEISSKDIKKQNDKLLEGKKEDILPRIAKAFVVPEKVLKDSLHSALEGSIWYFISPPVEIDGFGRPMTAVKVDDDGEGLVFHEGKHGVKYHFYVCMLVMKEYISKTATPQNDILEHCYKSSIFDQSHKLTLERGIRAFIEQDYIACISVLVPEIEHLLRRLTRQLEIPTWEPFRGETFHVKTLGTLLNDVRMATALGSLLFELKFLFSDTRGFNIRNDFCHGLMSATAYNEISSVMLIHILLCLGLISK